MEGIEMNNSFKIDPTRTLVEMKISGAFNFTKFRSFFESVLNHPDFRPGFKIFCDAREMDFNKMTRSDIDELVKLDKDILEKRGHGKTAFLVKEDLQFGMSRMVELQRDESHRDPLNVFKNLDRARKWLEI
jgi:Holliday junction resolvase RusA-like endonuclease